MAQIATTDARNVFTKKVIDVYKERPVVFNFLRSFFPNVESDTKEVSIEVQRGSEFIAVDVERGTEGQRNTFSKSSEKIIVPPYYREYFEATDLDFYDQLFGGAMDSVDDKTFAGWLDRMTEKLVMLRDKIERAYEVQCAQVLEDGIVQLVSGGNIDFKRKALSLVALGAGFRWNEATGVPLTDLETACTFIRTKGKAQGGIYNVIMGAAALSAFMNNVQVKAQADLRRIALVDINAPQRDALGGAFHGQVSAGSYILNIWTYPEYYDTKALSNIPYIDDKKVVVIPTTPRFKLGFGAVPMVFRDERRAEFPEFIQQTRAAFVIGNRVDDRGDKHIFDIKSAGIAVPVAVDQIHTTQVLV
jgi:hypothetical protein